MIYKEIFIKDNKEVVKMLSDEIIKLNPDKNL